MVAKKPAMQLRRFRDERKALSVAKAKADQPWPERVEGAKAAVRDADQAKRAHIAANLAELVEALEQDGEAAAQRVDAAAASLVSAYLEREQIAQSLGALLSMGLASAPVT